MTRDDWGRDPGVQQMRRIFGKIEKAQGDFFRVSGLSSFDERLREWRRTALKKFERAWGEAARMSVVLSDDEIAGLYVMCLARVLQREGMKVPALVNEANEKIKRFLERDS